MNPRLSSVITTFASFPNIVQLVQYVKNKINEQYLIEINNGMSFVFCFVHWFYIGYFLNCQRNFCDSDGASVCAGVMPWNLIQRLRRDILSTNLVYGPILLSTTPHCSLSRVLFSELFLRSRYIFSH